jgi:hypothetical protein
MFKITENQHIARSSELAPSLLLGREPEAFRRPCRLKRGAPGGGREETLVLEQSGRRIQWHRHKEDG